MSARTCAIRSDAHQLAEFSDRIYAHSCRLAERCGITPSMPRICSRQQHHSNIQCDAGAKEYFRVSVLVPFLDYFSYRLGCTVFRSCEKCSSFASTSTHFY